MNPLINTHSPESTTFTRYFCGCIYETCVDTTLICPQHRSEPHRAFMTATQTVPVPRDHAVDTISRLTPASYARNRPMRLENRPDNSLHLLGTITDPNQKEWAGPEAEMVGLCLPCFVDHQMLTETGVSTCECPDPGCYYRWCGSTTGLHALWRFHAYGKSEQFTGYPEENIFNHGPHDQLPATCAAGSPAKGNSWTSVSSKHPSNSAKHGGTASQALEDAATTSPSTSHNGSNRTTGASPAKATKGERNG